MCAPIPASKASRERWPIRMTPDAEPELTRETAFHPRFSALTRNFTEYRGYWLPTRFSNDGPVEEYWACRERAAIMDLSPLRKFEVTGPDAEALLQYALTRDVQEARRRPGRLYRHVLRAWRHDRRRHAVPPRREQFPLDRRRRLWRRLAARAGREARPQGVGALVDRPAAQHRRAGAEEPRHPQARSSGRRRRSPRSDELGWFRFTVGRIGGFDGAPVVVSRTGYTGELGYEIFCHPKDALTVFDAIWEAGQPHGLMPFGLQALDMLRIEAGLIFADYEFCDQTDPFEAGIGFTVPLEAKNDDFIGREALIRRKEHPQQKLVGLEIDGDEAVGHGDCVHIGRAQIGVVTSGTRSPILNKTIALARARRHPCRASAPRSRSASSTATRSGCRRASCASRTTIRRRRGCVRNWLFAARLTLVGVLDILTL